MLKINKEKMELEEAIKYIRTILRQKELPDAVKSLGYVYATEAIETVLGELEKLHYDNYRLDKENQKLFEININSIPKKKIEDKKKELEKIKTQNGDTYIDVVLATKVLQELLKL